MLKACCLLLCVSICLAGLSCPGNEFTDTTNQLCYWAQNEKKSFVDAQKGCQERGYSLILPLDSVMATYIQSFAETNLDKTESEFWIGVADLNHSGTYTTLNGTTLGYKHWGFGEPLLDRFCAEFQTANRFWGTEVCSMKLQSICAGIPSWYTGNPSGTTCIPVLADQFKIEVTNEVVKRIKSMSIKEIITMKREL